MNKAFNPVNFFRNIGQWLGGKTIYLLDAKNSLYISIRPSVCLQCLCVFVSQHDNLKISNVLIGNFVGLIGISQGQCGEIWMKIGREINKSLSCFAGQSKLNAPCIV
jgi:hypothetical protein